MKEIPLENPLARGRTADVYAWEDGTVLKLFHDWFDLESVEYEFKIAHAVHASGVKSPAVMKLIQVQGRNALVYERVAGLPLERMVLQKPWQVFSHARRLSELHYKMHQVVFSADMPSQQERLRKKIDLAEALSSSVKKSLLERLVSLPDGDRVCHGDFHPGNVLVTPDSSNTIDWIDAARGNPLADVARTSIILLGDANNQQLNPFLKWFVRIFHMAYLRRYFQMRRNGMDEYRLWLPIVAGARLSENIPELEKWLVKQASS
jgi:uncharacterized protein (TIGR02172 family)